MSDTRFTPGPWLIREPYGKGNGLRIESRDRAWPYLPEAWLGADCTSEEQIANACLIASAPDLYTVLAKLADADFGSAGWTDSLDRIAIQARAALAKARGEE